MTPRRSAAVQLPAWLVLAVWVSKVPFLHAEFVDAPLDASLGLASDGGEIMQLQLELEPRWEFNGDDGAMLVASARLRLDGQDKLEPGEPEFENYSSFSRPLTLGEAGTLELRDLYYERRLKRGLLRVGKQQIVWGRLDGVKILDVVNPQTYREFILDDLADSRIGQWSAYVDFTAGDWRTEVAWIPDLTSHDIPVAGAWFELTAPRFRFGASAGGPALEPDVRRDGDWLDDSAIGLRISRFVGGVDVSAQLYSGLDHEPLGRVSLGPGSPRLTQYYRRRDVVGVSAESAFGAIAWRAEIAHQPRRHFNRRGADGLSEVELDQNTIALGLDIQLPADLFANVQWVFDRVDSAPVDLVRPEEDQLMTVFLRRSFAYDTFRSELRWYHSLTDHDDTVLATLSYDVGDNTEAFVTSEWFSGSPDGLFGQFAERDRVYLGFTHHF